MCFPLLAIETTKFFVTTEGKLHSQGISDYNLVHKVKKFFTLSIVPYTDHNVQLLDTSYRQSIKKMMGSHSYLFQSNSTSVLFVLDGAHHESRVGLKGLKKGVQKVQLQLLGGGR